MRNQSGEPVSGERMLPHMHGGHRLPGERHLQYGMTTFPWSLSFFQISSFHDQNEKGAQRCSAASKALVLSAPGQGLSRLC